MADLTGFKQDRQGTYIEKDPYSVLDYTLAWADWMPSSTVALVIDSSTNTTTNVTATISGGTVGNIYNVEYRIVTDTSLRDSRNFRIKVVEREL